MSYNLVVLISSKVTGGRSGKGSVAKFIKEYEPETFNCEEYEFSLPIKNICVDVFGIPREDLYSEKKDIPIGIKIEGYTYNATPRDVMKYVGTEMFRETFGKNVWVDCAARKITKFFTENQSKKCNVFIVSDWRFDNEYTVLSDQGMECILVDVVRPGNSGLSTHASDTGLTIPDGVYSYHLANSGSLDDLREETENMMECIREEHGGVGVTRPLSNVAILP